MSQQDATNPNNQQTDDLNADISSYNQTIDDADDSTVNTDEPILDTADDDAAGTGDEPKKDDESDDEGDGDGKADDAGEASEFAFTPDADDAKFDEETKAYLETVEITPQLQTIFDRQTARIAELTAAASVPSGPSEIDQALDRMFETQLSEDGAEAELNTQPLVEVLREKYAKELPSIARSLFEADSTKYEGFSVFEERLVDDLGATPEKVAQIKLYLEADAPLPLPPPPTPKGIDKSLVDAWKGIGEAKRFEIEGVLADIESKRAELEETEAPFYKQKLEDELNTLQGKLNGELSLMKQIQVGIDAQRQSETTRQNQIAQNRTALENKVVATVNTEIFTLADEFSQNIAESLTFLDEDARLPAARDMSARVLQALERNADGTASPTAEYIAKQLKDEGVKFDFANGRKLLNDLQIATKTILTLERDGASARAIELAREKKANLIKDIKLEKKSLLGQITAKYVKSSSTALQKKVASAQANKQKTRGVLPKGTGAAPRKSDNVDKDIEAYNREMAKRNATGENLYDYHAS